jgi:hypothetical protein
MIGSPLLANQVGGGGAWWTDCLTRGAAEWNINMLNNGSSRSKILIQPILTITNLSITARTAQSTRIIPEMGRKGKKKSTAKKAASAQAEHEDARELCLRCEALDFEQLFAQLPRKEDGKFITDLGKITTSWLISACPVCRLFAAVTPGLSDGEELDTPCSLYAYNSFLRLEGISQKRAPFVILGVQRGDLHQWNYIGEVVGLGKPSQRRGLRLVQPDQIDFPLLNEWLTDCERIHTHMPSCNKGEPLIISGLKAIDCTTHRIVPAPGGCRYVALSYVWGPPTSEGEVIDNQLPEVLPQTIEDAITVTLRLGFSYIWIDRYCIPQSDGDEKFSQIRQMDSIYESAQLTIFAIAGEDPSHGLPGVSKPRTPQATAKAGKHTLAALRDFPRNLVMRSKWDTRAWTFQEGILSGRRFFFCDTQIHFDCYGMKCQEDLAQSIHYEGEDDDLKNFDHLYYSMMEMGVGRKSFEIGRCIYGYTSRQLSFESDLLNGIMGVLCALEDLDNPIYHFWGVPMYPVLYKANDGHLLPVSTSREDQFIAGLQWLYVQPAKRCPDFPSWSWTGWIGTPCSYGTRHWRTEDVSKTASTGIQVSVELRTGDILPWAEFEARKYLKDEPASWSPYLVLEVWAVPIKLLHVPEGIRRENGTVTSPSEIFAKIGIDGGRWGVVTQFYPDDVAYKEPKTKEGLSSLSFTGILLWEPVVSVEQQPYVLVAEEKNGFVQRVGSIYVGAMGAMVLDDFLEAYDGGRKKVTQSSIASETPPRWDTQCLARVGLVKRTIRLG